METKIIDGKRISEEIKQEVKEKTAVLNSQGVSVSLAVVLVGENAASKVYIKNKRKACEQVGIKSMTYELPGDTPQQEVLAFIEQLNESANVNGILVQLPLPAHIKPEKLIYKIAPEKDVDCFHPQNVGLVQTGGTGFLPCTPAGIIELLRRSNISVSGKKCVVIGRSNIVGKPISMLLLKENGTVTICHTKTENLKEICRQADIIVAAAGRPKTVTAEMVKPGAVIIDVGMNRNEQGKLCGDVDFEAVKPICAAITPVPGGVGPMTIAMLLKNCIKAAEMQLVMK